MISDPDKVQNLFLYSEINNNIFIKNSNYMEFGNTASLYTDFLFNLLLSVKQYNKCHRGNWHKKNKLGSRLYFNDKLFKLCGYITHYKSILIEGNKQNYSFQTVIKLEIDTKNSQCNFNKYYDNICYFINNRYSSNYMTRVTIFKDGCLHVKAHTTEKKLSYPTNNLFPGTIYVIDGYPSYKKCNHINQICSTLINFSNYSTFVKVLTKYENNYIDHNNIYIIDNLSNFDDALEKLYLFLNLIQFSQNTALIISVDNYKESILKYPRLTSYVTYCTKIK
jgi:hypothetical protein